MAHLERNPPLHPRLRENLVQVWVEVSNAGGAVGFVPPVTAEEVWPVASRAFDRVAAGTDDLVVAHDGPGHGPPAGFAFLAANDWALASHWGTIKRLQTRPDRRGRGIGAALLGELEEVARARGLVRVVLTVRGGTGIEDFYLGRGFALDARLPGRLRVAEGDEREELVLSKVVTGNAPAGPTLRVRRLDPDLPLPAYAHPGDAGLDLSARADVTLEPGARAVVPTGVAIAVPPGCVGLVHPRSGLAARAGIAIVNAPGTIDAGYRGEVKVVLVNLDAARPVAIARGDRIAQLVVQRVESVVVAEVDELPGTVRDEGGFGSTGT